MTRIRQALYCAAALCLLLAAGCGISDLTHQEADTAIRSHLQNSPLEVGIRVGKINKLLVLHIIGSDETAKAAELKETLDAKAAQALAGGGAMKVDFVSADIDATVFVDKTNTLKPGSVGTTTIAGGAWFMVTKDGNKQIKVTTITPPSLPE